VFRPMRSQSSEELGGKERQVGGSNYVPVYAGRMETREETRLIM
jgi:hypothetical protein